MRRRSANGERGVWGLTVGEVVGLCGVEDGEHEVEPEAELRDDVRQADEAHLPGEARGGARRQTGWARASCSVEFSTLKPKA
jgi:hypothetical protein